MNRWLNAVERELEAHGIDLSEGRITNDEIAVLMTVVDGATVEAKNTDLENPIWIPEELFIDILKTTQDMAPKLVIPGVIHYELDPVFLEPVLQQYLLELATEEEPLLEDYLADSMPEQYLAEMSRDPTPEKLERCAQAQSQHGFDAL